MKIGIIRCYEESMTDCQGWNCFSAIANKTGEFSKYDKIELIGFDTCGGCGQGRPDKIVKRAKRLKEHGAEVIHLGNCLASDMSKCPYKKMYAETLRKRLKIPIMEGTHGGPTPEQIAAYKEALKAKKAKRKAR